MYIYTYDKHVENDIHTFQYSVIHGLVIHVTDMLFACSINHNTVFPVSKKGTIFIYPLTCVIQCLTWVL